MTEPRKPKISETVVHPSVRLREADVGRHCEILDGSRLEYSSLGDYSYIGENCEIADASIGRFTAIANSVRIGPPNHPMDRPSQHRFTYCPEYYDAAASRDTGFFQSRRAARVHVGNDVWIGHGALLLPEITVGDGAVIAGGAVVSRDVPPYTIVGGVPARRIRDRFPPHVAASLARIEWWLWPDRDIFGKLDRFQTNDIEAFCRDHDPAFVSGGNSHRTDMLTP